MSKKEWAEELVAEWNDTNGTLLDLCLAAFEKFREEALKKKTLMQVTIHDTEDGVLASDIEKLRGE